MKRFLLVLILLSIVVFGILQIARQRVRNDLSQPVSESVLSPSPTLVIAQNQKQETLLFVPYWSNPKKNELDSQYDDYIYFGITPGEVGINGEAETKHIEEFTKAVPAGKTKLLTLRMVDANTNTAVLKNPVLQQKIAAQAVHIAQTYGFSGVVLDLEISALPFDSLITQINTFTTDLATEVKKNKLKFSILLYGDTLYRARPFDIKTLARQADRVMVMSYDFHKTRGNPGPNFPLQGKETYGYDLSQMADDFLRIIPSDKIVIVFGMYGYDWVVDSAGKAIDAAGAVTDSEVQKKFLDNCTYKDCHVIRDARSAETNVSYTDSDGKKHSVWFENAHSVQKKEDYLKSVGLVKYGYWAYSYF